VATSRTIYQDCEYCRVEFGQPDDPGRKRRFCSNACRQAAYRARVRQARRAREQREREQREREQAWRRAGDEARQERKERRRQHARHDQQPPPHAGTSRKRAWCETCRGERGPHTFHHDDAAHDRARRRYESLCRKAAGTSFPHEAQACREKAEELRVKFGV
jgi:hypothetical protein